MRLSEPCSRPTTSQGKTMWLKKKVVERFLERDHWSMKKGDEIFKNEFATM
jgi:hypothetical protein